ncbi:MAG: isoprenyl transferase [Bacteroidia bacterium]|nr:isoprenyl transferase [Bacteroidia bacterium]NNC86734.1 isoprenyl transferase [Bacteroidia bacterium]NNM15636.1 isoprenyl transferase [Bacteroidia bacterium]
MSLKEQIDIKKLPRHVAIIMDGNGRWAKQQGEQRTFGHKNGVTAVREVTEAAAELGVEYLTLYAFSTENWNRPRNEIDALMDLLINTMNVELKTLNENDIRLSAIGDLKSLPTKCYDNLMQTIEATKDNKRMTLVLALSYSAKWEMTQAIQKIASKVKEGTLSKEDISEDVISDHLCTKDMPEPELLIRTSGENRISNFLLWQIAYSELYFTKTLWPEFDKEEFYTALIDYQKRERRFGNVPENLSSTDHA